MTAIIQTSKEGLEMWQAVWSGGNGQFYFKLFWSKEGAEQYLRNRGRRV